MKWVLNRLAEPSSWAGIGAIAVAAGVSGPLYSHIAAAGAGVAGLVAFLMREKTA